MRKERSRQPSRPTPCSLASELRGGTGLPLYPSVSFPYNRLQPVTAQHMDISVCVTCFETSFGGKIIQRWISQSSAWVAVSFLGNLFISLLFFGRTYGILVLQPGIEPMPPALGTRSPNHWTTSEVLCLPFLGQSGKVGHEWLQVGGSHGDWGAGDCLLISADLVFNNGEVPSAHPSGSVCLVGVHCNFSFSVWRKYCV